MGTDDRVPVDPEFEALVDAGRKGPNADAFREGLEARRQIVALGAQLRGARERAGLSQTALASRAGLTQSAISRLELGTMDRGGPALRTLLRYARGCGMTLDFALRPERAAEGDDEFVAARFPAKA